MHPYAADDVGAVDNQVVDNSSAKTFTAPAGARGCFISCRTADIWVRVDGGVAAANVGLIIPFGQGPFYLPFGQTVSAFGSAASCPTSVLWVR